MKALQPLEFVKDDPLPVGGVSVDPVTELLMKAKGFIERGWIQDQLFREGKVCSMGALLMADGWDGWRLATMSGYVGQALKRLNKAIGTEDIAKWNDHPDRTLAQVLAEFDRAIAQI